MGRGIGWLVCAKALIGAACLIVMAPALSVGQADRETWQPPEKIMDAIGVRPGMKVGEAGAGRGYFTFPLARRVGPQGVVFANDISRSSLDVIGERALREGVGNVKIVLGGVENPQFPEKNLDMIVMVYVLHELERPVPFVRSLHSYLKPGGSFVIIEKNKTVELTHSHFMTNSQVLATMSETGFELDRTETFLPQDTIYIYKAKRTGDIHGAAAAGDLDTVKALLEADPTLVEAKDDRLSYRGNTPLISACWGPPANIPQAAVANYLIDKGANINARNTSGGSPLYFAHENFDLAQRLIDKGADVNVRAYGGLTPLHQTAATGNLRVAKLLIDHGAELNSRSNQGTVLHALIIRERPDEAMAKLLVESGAKLQEFSFGNTELHLAAMRGFADLVPLLVKHGAQVNAVNEYGHTPLYYAARHGYRKAADALIAAGADGNAIVETDYGKTPQLDATLKEGEAYLWYLGSCAPCDGYAVKTKNHLLIFNPSAIDESPEAGLANGHLNPRELAGQKVTVLMTHRPLRIGASFSELAEAMPGADFVFNFKPAAGSAGNSDIPTYRLATSNETFSIGGIQVHTIPAMLQVFFESEGLGYLVEADGVRIFHSGLHVSGNEASQVAKYRKEIDYLKPFGPVDIAILPITDRHISVAYEPYLYLLDQLAPKASYLAGADIVTDEYRKCASVLRARNVQVGYPEGGIAVGERFHYGQVPTQKGQR